jgi:hypothetical protein
LAGGRCARLGKLSARSAWQAPRAARSTRTLDGMRSVAAAIRSAERVLPGRAAKRGAVDPRWQAIIAVAEFAQSRPDEVWDFAAKWGRHRSADLQTAIATCVLEHLLEHHFRRIFPRAAELARANRYFARTLSMCWLSGQAKRPANAKAFRSVVREVRHAI